MATTTATTIPASRSSQQNGLGDIASLISALSGIFAGKETTQTTQTKLDQGTLNAMLQSAMERNGGLAQILGGQRQAGLYNSSTSNLMANDFTARMATEVAKAGAPQTVTQVTPAAMNPLVALAGLGLMQAFSGGGKAKKAGEVAAAASPSTATANPGTAAAPGFFENPLGAISSGISGTYDTLASALGFGGAPAPVLPKTPGEVFTRSSPGAMGAVAPMQIDALMSPDFISDMGLSYASNPMTQQAKMLHDQVADFGGDAAGVPGFDSIGWASGLPSLMSGDLEGAIGSIGKSTILSLFGQALTPVLGPIGGILGAIFGGLFD